MDVSRKTAVAYIAILTVAFLCSLYLILYKETPKWFWDQYSHHPAHAHTGQWSLNGTLGAMKATASEINVSRFDKDRSINVLGSGANAEDIGFPSLNLFRKEHADTFSRFIRFNVSDDGSECRHRRFLIYTCARSGLCGGWGDRLRGIVSTFLMALLTNRTFLLDMAKPCDLNKLLRPNIYDWEKCLNYARTIRSTKSFHWIDRGNMNALLSDVINLGTTTVIRVNTNMQGVLEFRNHTATRDILPWLRTLPEEEIVGSILGILFKPSSELSERLTDLNTENIRNRRLVCTHIRTGNNPTMPNDAHLQEGVPNITRIFDFLMKYDQLPDTAIFVATDSMEIRNKARMAFSNFISPESRIIHVDRLPRGNSAELCDGFLAALLDQLILSRCDVLVLTRSNFGTMAAYMRGESRGLFQNIKAENQIQKVNLRDVKKGKKRWIQ